MEIRAIKTRIFRENEDLNSFIFKYVKKIPESSILVVASKIVALSEGRTSLDVRKKEDLIKQESDFTWKSKHVWLTIKNKKSRSYYFGLGLTPAPKRRYWHGPWLCGLPRSKELYRATRYFRSQIRLFKS